MKKWILIIALTVGGFIVYEKYIVSHNKNSQDIRESLGYGAELLQNITREVITSGPLRARVESPNSQLSSGGVFIYTNQNRSQNGKAELKLNNKLSAAAEAKIDDMFAQQYFEHISPQKKGPSDLAQNAGYAFIAIGENLALGNYKDDMALVQAWMDSPGHRENILSAKYDEIGIAVRKGMFEGKSTWLAVQEFGRPLDACPSLDETLKARAETGKLELVDMERQMAELKTRMQEINVQTQQDAEKYNLLANEYNNLAKNYNNRVDVIKQTVDLYNFQVRNFNQCAER